MDNDGYLVIIEDAGLNFSAYSPDVPGCVTTGDTVDETLQNFREALELHFEALREDGYPIPQPSTVARTLKLAA